MSLYNNEITSISLKRFTAFEDIKIDFSPGINILIGDNGTGKTHILKLLYTGCSITESREHDFGGKLINVFNPRGDAPGRLVKRKKGSSKTTISIKRSNIELMTSFSNHATTTKSVTLHKKREWFENTIKSVYIPVKEMLAHAPNFRSLYQLRDIHYSEVYRDIIDLAFRPPLKGPVDKNRKNILESIRQILDGKVITKAEMLFLKNRHGELEFTLLAEGLRKLGLLWLLIQNGSLSEGTVLFWDEPETNLNPKKIQKVVEILLELQKQGTQIFIATHDYVVLKWFDLMKKNENLIRFHSLYRNKSTNEIECESVDKLSELNNNMILDTFGDLYTKSLEQSLENNN